MNKSEIRVGGLYTARVSGRIVTVRVDMIREVPRQGGKGIYCTAYDVTNLTTGRQTTFRSAAKFREAVKDEPLGIGGLRGIKVGEVDLSMGPTMADIDDDETA